MRSTGNTSTIGLGEMLSLEDIRVLDEGYLETDHNPRLPLPVDDPATIKASFYGERRFVVFDLVPPNTSRLAELQSALIGIAEGRLVGDDELTICAVAVDTVVDRLLTYSPLALTPVARALHQLAVDLSDTVHGKKSGVLHDKPGPSLVSLREQARIEQSGRHSASRDDEMPAADCFQRLVTALGEVAVRIATPSPADRLGAYHDALHAVIVYLSAIGFSGPAMGPLLVLRAMLTARLSGKKVELLNNREWRDRLSGSLPGYKPVFARKEQFRGVLVVAWRKSKIIREIATLKGRRLWFENEIVKAALVDGGRAVTRTDIVKWANEISRGPQVRFNMHEALMNSIGLSPHYAPFRGDASHAGVRYLLHLAIMIEPP